MSEPLQIAIIDDHPLFREGVVHTLGAQPDIEVVGEGESAAEPCALLRSACQTSYCWMCPCRAVV
jgi:DNA-binding NarL/FixJ family response regulator